MDDRGINCHMVFLRGIICSFMENNGKWSVKGTRRDLGGQTGNHVLKFWKSKKIHIFQKLIILLSKTTCDDLI